MGQAALIELVGVRKHYRFGEAVVAALDGVDLRIAPGEFVGVIGRSGSGKSTFLNIVGGLDRPSDGQVLIEGNALRARTSDQLAAYRREGIGFVFQSFNLIPHLTALENVALPLALAGRGPFERRRRAEQLLEKVGLGKRMKHRPNAMSGGERQRVAIARALANEPRLLLCDEPTGNLDSRTAEEIMGMLEALHREGRTIVLVTHDRERAERYCGRIVVMDDGRVKEDRPVDRPVAAGGPVDRPVAAGGPVDRPAAGGPAAAGGEPVATLPELPAEAAGEAGDARGEAVA